MEAPSLICVFALVNARGLKQAEWSATLDLVIPPDALSLADDVIEGPPRSNPY